LTGKLTAAAVKLLERGVSAVVEIYELKARKVRDAAPVDFS
jgi:hypothetical protein